jgi:hypothetical protein
VAGCADAHPAHPRHKSTLKNLATHLTKTMKIPSRNHLKAQGEAKFRGSSRPALDEGFSRQPSAVENWLSLTATMPGSLE